MFTAPRIVKSHMMKKGVFTSLLSLLVACSSEPKADIQLERDVVADVLVSESWDGLIGDARRYADMPAIGGVILQNDSILSQGFDGTKKYLGDSEVSATDVWHVGSITKSMTATMIARLVERQILSWDDTIQDIFGTEENHADWHNVTLKALLTHTSGAGANFSTDIMSKWPPSEQETHVARQQAVADILAKAPNAKSTFVYSNVGYTIAGHMAEKKTGKVWETLMRDEVFDPLKLLSAGFGAPQPINDIAPIQGHIGKLPIDPSDFADNTPIMGPAGTVHMNLQDLAMFGQAHLSGLKGEIGYLSKETFEVLHAVNLNNYAMGWVEDKPRILPANSIFWHNGSNTMWYALLMVVPEQSIVYALATNTGDVETVDPVFNALIKHHLTEVKKTEAK